MAVPMIAMGLRLLTKGGRGIDLNASKTKVIDNLKKDIKEDVDELFEEFTQELRKKTPKDTGRASRGWKKVGKYNSKSNRSSTIIKNRVPYIDPLEKGHSKQAPKGMIDPAFDKVFKRKRRR